MTDVRSLLRHERASRRIQHAHASYSTGTLVCLICQLQVKSESLWEGHQRSPQHLMKLQRIRDGTDRDPTIPATSNGKKRKASDEGDLRRKRSRGDGLSDGFFDQGVEESGSAEAPAPPVPQEMNIPSRPATPASKKTVEATAKQPDIDEDEWAAFEADIAAAEVPTAADAVISAPAMSAAEIAARSTEETNTQRKERLEAELEGDKEDAARKLEDEFEEMESLEARVRRLREKREALRLKDGGHSATAAVEPESGSNTVSNDKEDDEDEEDDDDDDDEDDDWDSFRLRG